MIRKRVLFTTIAAGATVLATAAFHTENHPRLSVARTDFAHTVTPTTPAYLAQLPPLDPAPVKEFRIPIMDAKLQIAPGISYEGWTFGGTVPGPVMHVRQGDLVRITVINETPMPHSIDFHAARVPANVDYRAIMPRDSLQFEFTATDPGAFLVHCGTPPVLMHLMQGMYMTMIVDPRDGWGTKADEEFVLVQSEFYAKDGPGGTDAQPDYAAAQEKEASQVVFNGRAFQYKDHPLHVKVGDRVRLYVVNAGPSLTSDFHIVGAIFNRVYPDGDPAHVLSDVQTYAVPAGGGAVFETVFDAKQSGEGLYAFVTHSFADAQKGAVGLIQVGTPKQFATMDH